MTQATSILPDVLEIQPCTEEGKVTLEAKLGGNEERDIFDPGMLCRLLNASRMMEKARCSPEMGYGTMERDGRKIHVFKTGKVIVRRADGREQALEILSMVTRTVWGALLCGSGQPLLAAIGQENFPGLPPPPGDRNELAPSSAGLASTMDAARKTPEWQGVEEMLTQLRALSTGIRAGGTVPAKGKELVAAFRKVDGAILDFISRSPRPSDAAPGLVLLSVSYNLERAITAYTALGPEGREMIGGLTEEAVAAVLAGSEDRAKELLGKITGGAARLVTDTAHLEALLRLALVRLPAPAGA